MFQTLDALLVDFGYRHNEVRFIPDADGKLVVWTDDEGVVNFRDEPESGLLWLIAPLDALPSVMNPLAGPTAHDAGDWISQPGRTAGLEWSLSCNVQSLAMVMTAKMPSEQLDPDTFDRWLSEFLAARRAVRAGL